MDTLGPVAQLRAGRLGRRVPQLLVGLCLFGWSMAMMVRSDLGLAPWDVFHQGLSRYLPLSFGTIVILVGAGLLVLWIPLRQWPGFGTVLNAVICGLVADLGLMVIERSDSLLVRVGLLLGGIVLNGLATALYIGTHLGPGPRDGLSLGLVRATGRSLRVVRTCIEVAVLVVGFLLGGTVGIGTLLYAAGIGPLWQLFRPWTDVRLPDPAPSDPLAP